MHCLVPIASQFGQFCRTSQQLCCVAAARGFLFVSTRSFSCSRQRSLTCESSKPAAAQKAALLLDHTKQHRCHHLAAAAGWPQRTQCRLLQEGLHSWQQHGRHATQGSLAGADLQLGSCSLWRPAADDNSNSNSNSNNNKHSGSQHRRPHVVHAAQQCPGSSLLRQQEPPTYLPMQSQSWLMDRGKAWRIPYLHQLLPLSNSLAGTMQGYSTSSASSTTDTTGPTTSSSEPPKNLKGSLPGSGPSQKTLRGLPFTVSRAAAAEAFAAYHGQHWYQSRQRPLLAKPFKETYLPFWVGSGVVRVEVSGAEVGHEHLVTRYDHARKRSEPRWETVWSRVKLHLVWDRTIKAEEVDSQLYGSWKYPRSDVEVLRPGPLIKLARPITPDMLQASAGSGTDTRRVGPFTVEPQAARRLLMSHIEAAERKRAEEEVARLTGAQQVRFVDMHCTYMGSTGTARSGPAAAAGAGGLDLSPVYIPAYIFSWWHGGAKVRTFVSGVSPTTVSGAQVLDDTKLATYATLATAGLGIFLGLPAKLLLWGGLVVPFVAVGVVSRFWPLLRTRLADWREWLQRRWKDTVSGDPGYCEVNWNADFVHAYEAQETRRRQQEQHQSYWQDHGHGAFRGAAQDPREFFQQFMRDPFSFFEQHFARQQQQQQQQQSQRQQGYQSYQQQQQRQQTYGGGRATTGSRGDPLGYYNTLGVKPGCTTQEVQAAFRGLALKHHPDRYSTQADKDAATKKFQTITEAYQVLRDPKKRQLYDAGQYHDRA